MVALAVGMVDIISEEVEEDIPEVVLTAGREGGGGRREIVCYKRSPLVSSFLCYT